MYKTVNHIVHGYVWIKGECKHNLEHKIQY